MRYIVNGQPIIADADFMAANYEVGSYAEDAAVEEVQPTRRRVTKLDFIGRFEPAEFEAIMAASDASPTVKAWVFKFQSVTPDPDGTSIDLDDPRTIADVNGLESAQLIGVGRAAQILV